MEKVLKRTTVYKGKVLSVEEVSIDFNNGQIATFELMNFQTSTGVSALAINDKNQVYLCRHFQLGVNKRILTLPTGGLTKGEDPKKRMQIELQEEIGFKAKRLTLMTRAHAIPGYIGTKPNYIFLAKDLVSSTLLGDEHEDIEVVTIPISKLINLIKSGKIVDSRIILATLYYQHFYK